MKCVTVQVLSRKSKVCYSREEASLERELDRPCQCPAKFQAGNGSGPIECPLLGLDRTPHVHRTELFQGQAMRLSANGSSFLAKAKLDRTVLAPPVLVAVVLIQRSDNSSLRLSLTAALVRPPRLPDLVPSLHSSNLRPTCILSSTAPFPTPAAAWQDMVNWHQQTSRRRCT